MLLNSELLTLPVMQCGLLIDGYGECSMGCYYVKNSYYFSFFYSYTVVYLLSALYLL